MRRTYSALFACLLCGLQSAPVHSGEGRLWLDISVISMVAGQNRSPGLAQTASGAGRLDVQVAGSLDASGAGAATEKPSSSSNSHSAGGSMTATVRRAVEGDTLELSTGEKVRLLGVDTTEAVDPRNTVQFFRKEAAAVLHSLAAGKEVQIEFGDEAAADGRLLGYVYLLPKHLLLNEEIIARGYACSYPKYSVRPDLMRRFETAEQLARKRRLGLWNANAQPLYSRRLEISLAVGRPLYKSRFYGSDARRGVLMEEIQDLEDISTLNYLWGNSPGVYLPYTSPLVENGDLSVPEGFTTAVPDLRDLPTRPSLDRYGEIVPRGALPVPIPVRDYIGRGGTYPRSYRRSLPRRL